MYIARGLGASPLAQTIANAITRQEGINPAYNNPGGLVSGAGQTGTAPNGIAIFPDLATGQAAEVNLVQSYIDNGASIASMINAWAPAPSVACGGMCTGNNPSAYAQNVANWTNLDPTVPLNSLASATGSGAGSSWLPVDASGNIDLSGLVPDLSSIDWSDPMTWAVVLALGVGIFLLVRR